jgi:peptidoglycan hydrolase-like protein with peptidoglycan-binding domain
MVYPNYYARRLTAQAGWHRPGYPQAGAWRQGYGARPGAYGWQAGRQFGARPGYLGARNFAGRYQPRYGVGAQPRWHWLRHIGQGFRGQGLRQGGYWPQSSGYAGAAASYAPQDSGASAPPAQSLGPQWVSWAQSCLAQAVGSWVPQNGIMGKATRHAISKFQKQQQLPATGMLDAATINALQAACGGQAAAAAGPAAPPPPPPPPPPAPAAPSAPAGDDVAAATAAASGSGGPPPDGAPPDAGGPPPDAPSGELYLGRTRRHRRRWGSGFNFQQPQPQQPPDSDDDSEFFMGGRGRFRGWGGGTGYQQPDEDGDGNSNRWQRRRW